MTPTFRTSQPGSAADPTKPHLILVGLPGLGEDDGRAAAGARSSAGRSSISTREIERREGMTDRPDLRASEGEPYFRQLERELTRGAARSAAR